MNAFQSGQDIEQRALLDVLPYMQTKCKRVAATQGQLLLQKYAGDFVVATKNGTRTIELNAELENKHGNLFLETWSNRQRFTVGWMYTSQADWLWYYFIESRELYHVELSALKEWSFGCQDKPGRIYEFAEKRQQKWDQLNDTLGRCVPLTVLRNELNGSFKGPYDPLDSGEKQ